MTLRLRSLDYAAKTGETAFLDAHRSQLVAAFHFYDSRMKDGLVVQPPFSDWQDSVKREGATLYTNLLYQSLLERLQGQPGFDIAPQQVAAHREKMEAAFFDPGTGLYKSVAGQPQTSLDGNLLATYDAWRTALKQTTCLHDSYVEVANEMGLPVTTVKKRCLGLRAKLTAIYSMS